MLNLRDCSLRTGFSRETSTVRSFAREKSDRYCDLNFYHYGAIFRGDARDLAAGYARNVRDHFYKNVNSPQIPIGAGRRYRQLHDVAMTGIDLAEHFYRTRSSPPP